MDQNSFEIAEAKKILIEARRNTLRRRYPDMETANLPKILKRNSKLRYIDIVRSSVSNQEYADTCIEKFE